MAQIIQETKEEIESWDEEKTRLQKQLPEKLVLQRFALRQTISSSSLKLEQNSKHAWFVQYRVFSWRVLEGRTVLQTFCRSKKPELLLISK